MGSERRRIEGESVLGLVDEHAHEFEGAEHGAIKGYTRRRRRSPQGNPATTKDSRRSCRGDRRSQSERAALHDLRQLDRRPAIIARCTSVSERKTD